MPDLKIKLDNLLSDAIDCQMIGNLATEPTTRAEYRQRAEQFRTLAEQVRRQITERPRDIGFLIEQALRCRRLAETLSDLAMKDDLISLAAELEQTARPGRGSGN
jgi:hypothetical protein